MASSGFRFPPEIFTATELGALARGGLGSTFANGLCSVVSQLDFTDIWQPGGVRPWLQVAEPLRMSSTDANDTLLGTGARVVLLEGLDAGGTFIQELVDMNGTSLTAPTSKSFFRLNDALVRNVGTYGGVNAGDITIETATAISQAVITTERARAEHIHRTTPNKFLGLLFSLSVGIDANKTAIIRFKIRTDAEETTAPFFPIQTVFEIPGMLGFRQIPAVMPALIPPFSDIWIDALGDSPNTVVGATYSLLFVPEG